ncbi:origin recognition complex subunit 4, partial [Dimargaris xerosporica]
MLTCQPATSNCPAGVGTEASPTVTWAFPSESVGQSLVSEARREILTALNEHGPPRELVELAEPLHQIHALVEKAVVRAESNSVLIVGQRGVGKTTLVRHAITSVMQQHGPFRMIHLNGLLQTSDKMALRAIAQQLDAPAQDVAALTDIDHEDNDDTPDALRPPKRTFAEALLHMLTVLQSGRRKSKAIVFVLDEFDLFTQHPKQTLLYTLFDAVQCHMLPLLVIGLTSRLDVVE